MAAIRLARELTDFLGAQSRMRFQWGDRDCGLFIADWVRARRGIDPCAYSRGKYTTEDEAKIFFAGKFGLVRAVGRALKSAGLIMTAAPQTGDVGVIVIGWKAACAIKTENAWVARIETGLCLIRAPRVIAAWKV